MRVLLACDKFKGSLTSAQVHALLRPALESSGHSVESLPVADGGDGTVAAALVAGFSERRATVTGPLGDPVTAAWARREATGAAVIELAQASGLALFPDGPSTQTALESGSHGTGELILEALNSGCTRIVVGVGGSACTDGGSGMLTALGARLEDSAGAPIPAGGGGLAHLSRIDLSAVDARLRDGTVELLIATDVDNPLLGDHGAAAVYGPQKGAGPRELDMLETALHRFAAQLDPAAQHRDRAGAGAAGGTAFGAFAALGAQAVAGAQFVLDLIGFAAALQRADIVITGEGRFDEQTLSGKGPGAVIAAATGASLPVHIVCGSSEVSAGQAAALGLAGVHPMTDHASLEECLHSPEQVLTQLADMLAAELAAQR